MKKTIVIVDPFSTGALLAPQFSTQGHDVYGVLSSASLSDYFKQSYTGEFFINATLLSPDEIKQQVRQVDEVIVGAESGVFCAEALAAHYHLQANHTSSSALRRNKYLMQMALKAKGLNYIQTEQVSKQNLSMVLDALREDQAYVLKPISSAGSDGVLFFPNKEGLAKHMQCLDWDKEDLFGQKNTHYLIQSYVQGQEFVVDMMVHEGQVFVASLCAYEKVALNGRQFIYQALNILDPHDLQYQALIQYAIDCTSALAIEYGPVHMELFMTDQGYPVMIEAGARLHGGVAPQIFQFCYEPHLLSAMVNYYVDKKLPLSHMASKVQQGKILFLINQQEGAYLHQIDQLAQAFSSLSSYAGHQLFFTEDQVLPMTIDLTNISGAVWLAHQSQSQLQADELRIRQWFNEAVF